MGIDQLASGGDVPDDLDVDSVSTDDATINSNLTIGFEPLELGLNASTTGSGAVSVGQSSTAASDGTALGDGANGSNGVAVGKDASVDSGNTESLAIGSGATAEQNGAIAIGNGSASAFDSIFIGIRDNVSTGGLARIGGNQLAFGGQKDTVADPDLRNSELTIELDESNNAFRLRGKDSDGTIREATISW